MSSDLGSDHLTGAEAQTKTVTPIEKRRLSRRLRKLSWSIQGSASIDTIAEVLREHVRQILCDWGKQFGVQIEPFKLYYNENGIYLRYLAKTSEKIFPIGMIIRFRHENGLIAYVTYASCYDTLIDRDEKQLRALLD